MKKKKLTVLWIAAIGVAALAGCGKKEEHLAELDTSKYVTLGEYSGMTVTVDPIEEITDEAVENYLNQSLLASYAEQTDVTDRPVQSGDTVYYSCVGTIDGEVFDGGSTAEGEEWNTVIGSGKMIDGFEDGIIGMEIGEVRDVPCTFPDPYEGNPELSGKEAVFTITLNSVSVTTYPELTEELLAEIGSDYATPQEARDAVRSYLESSAQSVYEDNVRNALLSAMLTNCEFQDPPEFLVERNEQAFKDNILYYASMYGYTDIIAFAKDFYGMTEEQFNDQVRVIGETASKETLAIEALADAEGLSDITDEELDAEAQTYVEESSSHYATVDALYEDVGRDTFRDYVISIRVQDWLQEHNTVETN